MISNLVAATYGSVSDIEIVWTFIAFLGFIFAVHNWKEARKDLVALREANIKNGRVIVARGAYWSELGRMIVQGIFVSIGSISLSITSPPPGQAPLIIDIATALVRWGLIVGAVILTSQSFLVYQTRKELNQQLGNNDEEAGRSRE